MNARVATSTSSSLSSLSSSSSSSSSASSARLLESVGDARATASTDEGVAIDPRLDGGKCACERGASENARVRCFVDHYARFQARRGIPLTYAQTKELYETTSASELRVAEFTCRDTSEELALSLILYSFLETYCKTHPRFALDVPFGNCFKGKINFFNSI